MWTQVAGKVVLSLTPLVNHYWNIAFQITPRGLQTPVLIHDHRTSTLTFDFVAHELVILVSDGSRRTVPLQPQTVADFYVGVMGALDELGIHPKVWTMPVEVVEPIRFESDTTHRSYDREAVGRFWEVVLAIKPVLEDFRAEFIGKCSPVHFFWGSFDLAVTRFSGRTAPPLTSHSPNLGDWVMREAYSHEVSSCGFWPGNGGLGYPAFYAYAYPEPAGFGEAPVPPPAAYNTDLGQFILPYEAVRTANSPDDLLLQFLQSTYEACADRAPWDRHALERQGPMK